MPKKNEENQGLVRTGSLLDQMFEVAAPAQVPKPRKPRAPRATPAVVAPSTPTGRPLQWRRVNRKLVQQAYTFDSDSSSREYETLLFADGTTSCNCPGWTRRTDDYGGRSCKHTTAVAGGRGMRTATHVENYRT